MWYLHAILKGKQFLNQMDIWLLVLDIKENLSVYWFTNYVLFKMSDKGF